ncbi:baseplate J/gp47 family protein [Acidisoma cellulosilytica]|uniref:Baseplate J/gp47 family protein n=1 Tax=Acidisoma cellulosilyticum TaxID=2802395 RepID=A0A964E585_9PROT|nr:baseplate J/gp47 family protein [Acidisoma cellulosilyticum]MCB8881718.1 baseplate J/gp47 family protein [Acidisoma cellulosilyticum]
MPTLSLRSVSQMLSSAAAAAQASCAQLLDLSIGSPARAILWATSALWSWNQSNTDAVLQASRLATCVGSDVDSFVGDYGLSRAPATYATGQVTLGRNVYTGSATVLVGYQVRTADGSITYNILADPTNQYWSATAGTAGGYVLPPGIQSITVNVQCTTIGAIGNVIAGAISLFGTNISGIDTVTNSAAIENGDDAESDASLKLAFVAYLASLPQGTVDAIINAVNSVQAGITCSLANNFNSAGVFTPGWFTVYVDDGSGDPPASLLNTITTIVNKVRAVSVQSAVLGPNKVLLNINLSISVSSGTAASLYAGVQQAVSAYVNSLPVGATCTVFGISQAAAASSTLITNVSAVNIQQTTPAKSVIVDLAAPTSVSVFKAGQVVVNS